MKQLDEIERLARDVIAPFPDREYASPARARDAAAAIRADREPELARTLLAVLPVVRAAEEWVDAGMYDEEERADLIGAIDDLRRRLSGGG